MDGRARTAADLRVRRLRSPSRAAAVVDRRPDARDRLDVDRLDVRAVRVLPPARPRRRRVPRGAQIDRFGNLNTTVIGHYEHPKVRLPGSGGACEIAIHAKQILVIMRQAQRAFVAELHFRTSPGHSGDPAHDAARGWSGSGPTSVVTDLGTYGFNASTGEMTLLTTHPGVSLDDVRANMGWEPPVAADVGETPAPSAEELRLIREELDPQGIYTK